MKQQFKRSSIALAVAALAASPAVFAGGEGDHNGSPISEHYSVSVNNSIDVKLKKEIKNTKNVDISGHVSVFGAIPVTSSAMAVVDDKQINTGNVVSNTHHTNNATASGGAMSGASGNIGLNISAGDNNMQDNAAALSAADAYFVFGSADAEIFVTQANASNATLNSGNVNTASLGGDVLSNAKGNIGVNISAGSSNLQKNNLAVSSAPSRLSEASVANVQRSANNTTVNAGRLDVYRDTTYVELSGPVRGYTVGYEAGGYAGNTSGSYAGNQGGAYYGWQGGSYSGQESGSTAGMSWQASNIYPDAWATASTPPGYQHPTDGPTTGHVDIDNQTQGAVQNPLRPGVGGLAFDNRGSYGGTQSGTYSGGQEGYYYGGEAGNYRGSERGNYAGYEVGYADLAANLSGYVTTTRLVYTPTANNASLSGNALAGATGNIGVNIAAGTGNMQSNSLAVSYATPALCTACSGGGAPGGER